MPIGYGAPLDSTRGVLLRGNPVALYGLPQYPLIAGTQQDAASQVFENPSFLIGGVTGGSIGPADVASTQTAAVSLWPAASVGPNLRIMVINVWMQLLGNVAWTNTSGANPGLVITDTSTNQTPVCYVPQASLMPGFSATFPDAGLTLPFTFGASQTLTAIYTVSTTVNASTLALSASPSLVTTLYANQWITIIDDTTTPANIGCTCQIKSQVSTTTFTLANFGFVNSSGAQVVPSSNAVYATSYYGATSGSNTTAVLPAAANWASHQLQGFNVYIAGGTGAGQGPAAVSDNTTTTPTFASRNTAAASGSMFQVSTGSNLGCIDFGIGNQSLQLGYNAGLQASVVGVEAAGSNVRIGWLGYLRP